ncbi:MAG: hypothetical protein JJV97_02785 [SAR324 cluster bacterium]|nr:hypothetical protein [SAR324 cluster bacterium]
MHQIKAIEKITSLSEGIHKKVKGLKMVNYISNSISSLPDKIAGQSNYSDELEHKNQPGTDLEHSRNHFIKANSPKLTAINRYLVMIAKLEVGIKNNMLNQKIITDIINHLAKRINDLSEQEVKLIEKTTEFKQANLSLSSDLKKVFSHKLSATETREELFTFLKSKPLIAILKDEPQAPTTYHSRGKMVNHEQQSTISSSRGLFKGKSVHFNPILGLDSYQGTQRLNLT